MKNGDIYPIAEIQFFKHDHFQTRHDKKIKRIIINVNNPRAFVGFHHN